MKKPTGDKLSLEVKKRDVFGKKLKKLRKEGFIPANIYGPDYTSQSIQVGLKDFTHAYRVVRETGVVYLNGLKDEVPVLIKHVQLHPVDDTILHVDFRKIDLLKKVQTEVPVTAINQSEAVSQKAGILLQQMKTLTVEALPQNIPHEIQVDISVIKELGQEIKVDQLPKSDTYVIKNDPTLVVLSVVAHKEESVTPETTAAAAPEVLTEAVKPEEGAEAAPIEKGAPPAQPAKEPAAAPKAAKPEAKK